MDKKKDLKKKRLIVLLSVIGVIALLVLLNSLDFATPSNTPGATETEYTPETYPEEAFLKPDYTEDITKNQGYMKLDRTISYLSGNQTFSLENGYNPESGALKLYVDFFVKYFDALQEGFAGSSNTASGFNALYSDVYFRSHRPFGQFAPQKVYDIAIERLSDIMTVTVAETEADRAFLGWSVVDFKVSYRIFENDGTFRRDINNDELLPQYIRLLCDKKGNVTINSIGYQSVAGTAPEEESIIAFVMPLVWLILIILFFALLLFMKKPSFFIFAVSAVIAFIFSLVAPWYVPLILFILLSTLTHAARYIRMRVTRTAPKTPDTVNETPEEET